MWSALTVAYNLHPIKIIAFVVMGNHVHLIVLVEDPSELESFMERFKCETAHAVNRLLGRRQVTVWCEGYDSPAILTPADLVEKLAYVYANPVRAHLTDSIENYLGVSSWKMFSSEQHDKATKRIRRNFLTPLPKKSISPSQQEQFASVVQAQSTEEISFKLHPTAWTVAFPYYPSQAELHQKVIDRVREIEQEMALVRAEKVISIPSAANAITRSMHRTYSPKTFGRRMWCISGDIPLRIAFIRFIKTLRKKAYEVRQQWIRGNWTEPFPPGLFPPCIPPLANLLPQFVRRATSPA